MKQCRECNNKLELTYFHKITKNPDGLSNYCKNCTSLSKKKTYKDNKKLILNKRKTYYEKNKDKILQRAKKYYDENKESVKFNTKEYYEKNKPRARELNQEWIRNNKEKNKAYHKLYVEDNRDEINLKRKNRYKNDIQFKLSIRLRNRLNRALKSNSRKGSAVKNLGCSIEFLKEYLENKFTPEMNWDNYGTYWHIDHIIPLSHFDLSNLDELLNAVHYTNLQPLTAVDNYKKGNRRK